MRCASTVVLPVPAPATTSIGPCTCSMAVCCSRVGMNWPLFKTATPGLHEEKANNHYRPHREPTQHNKSSLSQRFRFQLQALAVSMEGLSLSAIIITLNEEANLPRTLASVAWADEIVVLDSGSTDRTREIAESFKAKFFCESWKGFAAQKNSA